MAKWSLFRQEVMQTLYDRGGGCWHICLQPVDGNLVKGWVPFEFTQKVEEKWREWLEIPSMFSVSLQQIPGTFYHFFTTRPYYIKLACLSCQQDIFPWPSLDTYCPTDRRHPSERPRSLRRATVRHGTRPWSTRVSPKPNFPPWVSRWLSGTTSPWSTMNISAAATSTPGPVSAANENILD